MLLSLLRTSRQVTKVHPMPLPGHQCPKCAWHLPQHMPVSTEHLQIRVSCLHKCYLTREGPHPLMAAVLLLPVGMSRLHKPPRSPGWHNPCWFPSWAAAWKPPGSPCHPLPEPSPSTWHHFHQIPQEGICLRRQGHRPGQGPSLCAGFKMTMGLSKSVPALHMPLPCLHPSVHCRQPISSPASVLCRILPRHPKPGGFQPARS